MSLDVTLVRDEDGVTLDRVLLRDSKRAASPTLVVSPMQWRAFLSAALVWDADESVYLDGGLRLMNTRMVGAELPVCISSESLAHLHFGMDEWREFVEAAALSGGTPEPTDG